MTLGGLALAVGILVDDSTVTIENTHRLWTEEHMPLSEATLHGAAEIAVPTLVSTLAISCVFTSVVFLDGPAKYLFTPLGLAVVFAMLASYGLSRTLTPITIGLLLKGETSWHGGRRACQASSRGYRPHSTAASSACVTDMRDCSPFCCSRRAIVPVVAVLILGLGAVMLTLVGRDFFPLIDGGQIQLHVRAPAGTRIESTEAIFQAGRGQDPRSHSGQGPRAHYRQYRAAGASLQSGIRGRFHDRNQRRCHPGGAQGRPQADRRLCQEIASGAARRISRRHVLFPGRRHRDADSELRIAGADRRPDGGHRPQQPFGCKGAPSAPRRDSRHRRRASAAGSRWSGVLRPD